MHGSHWTTARPAPPSCPLIVRDLFLIFKVLMVRWLRLCAELSTSDKGLRLLMKMTFSRRDFGFRERARLEAGSVLLL